MCGRFFLDAEPSEVGERFAVAAPNDLAPRYNITPDRPILTVRVENGARRLGPMRWGLLPPWATDAQDKGRQINARAETAATKPMFRHSFRHRRCLVPASGFYEWQRAEGGAKRPYCIRRQDHAPVAFAGLWSCLLADDGEPLYTVAIVTCNAPPNLRAIHHRVPLMLRDEALDPWLDPAVTDSAILRRSVRALPEDALAAYPISRRVNSPAHDDAELLAPMRPNDDARVPSEPEPAPAPQPRLL